jgi:hypothetical protein
MSKEALGDGPHQLQAIVAVKTTVKTKAKTPRTPKTHFSDSSWHEVLLIHSKASNRAFVSTSETNRTLITQRQCSWLR